ncbi:MAG: hypothetical protein DRH49_06865 [Candidatus Coatesbacteria bacterium]|nr:MAG: hypothetical protein DRH49_06865 [Candidatus Coatesbacteria bacterium]
MDTIGYIKVTPTGIVRISMEDGQLSFGKGYRRPITKDEAIAALPSRPRPFKSGKWGVYKDIADSKLLLVIQDEKNNFFRIDTNISVNAPGSRIKDSVLEIINRLFNDLHAESNAGGIHLPKAHSYAAKTVITPDGRRLPGFLAALEEVHISNLIGRDTAKIWKYLSRLPKVAGTTWNPSARLVKLPWVPEIEISELPGDGTILVPPEVMPHIESAVGHKVHGGAVGTLRIVHDHRVLFIKGMFRAFSPLRGTSRFIVDCDSVKADNPDAPLWKYTFSGGYEFSCFIGAYNVLANAALNLMIPGNYVGDDNARKHFNSMWSRWTAQMIEQFMWLKTTDPKRFVEETSWMAQSTDYRVGLWAEFLHADMDAPVETSCLRSILMHDLVKKVEKGRISLGLPQSGKGILSRDFGGLRACMWKDPTGLLQKDQICLIGISDDEAQSMEGDCAMLKDPCYYPEQVIRVSVAQTHQKEIEHLYPGAQGIIINSVNLDDFFRSLGGGDTDGDMACVIKDDDLYAISYSPGQAPDFETSGTTLVMEEPAEMVTSWNAQSTLCRWCDNLRQLAEIPPVAPAVNTLMKIRKAKALADAGKLPPEFSRLQHLSDNDVLQCAYIVQNCMDRKALSPEELAHYSKMRYLIGNGKKQQGFYPVEHHWHPSLPWFRPKSRWQECPVCHGNKGNGCPVCKFRGKIETKLRSQIYDNVVTDCINQCKSVIESMGIDPLNTAESVDTWMNKWLGKTSDIAIPTEIEDAMLQFLPLMEKIEIPQKWINLTKRTGTRLDAYFLWMCNIIADTRNEYRRNAFANEQSEIKAISQCNADLRQLLYFKDTKGIDTDWGPDARISHARCLLYWTAKNRKLFSRDADEQTSYTGMRLVWAMQVAGPCMFEDMRALRLKDDDRLGTVLSNLETSLPWDKNLREQAKGFNKTLGYKNDKDLDGLVNHIAITQLRHPDEEWDDLMLYLLG